MTDSSPKRDLFDVRHATTTYLPPVDERCWNACRDWS
jgi:hypothetical protein